MALPSPGGEDSLEEYRTPELVPRDLGVSLEFVRYSNPSLYLLLVNDSSYDVRYGDGFDIVGNLWGSFGTSDEAYSVLPAGEQREICLRVVDLGPGEFRVSKIISIEPKGPNDLQMYTLQAEFAMENLSIPAEMRDAKLSADPDFVTSIGALIEITNGLAGGRLFFDKSFTLQQNSGGSWVDLPPIASTGFPDETYSLAPRQAIQIVVYWAWLYGDLPVGEYRIAKSFWQIDYNGKKIQLDRYATFTVEGKSIPNSIYKNGSDWRHPLSGITTFRASVVETTGSDPNSLFEGSSILVDSQFPVIADRQAGEKYIIYDSQSIIVLDANGNQISFSDIKAGMIVKVTYNGLMLTSKPAQICGALLIELTD
jgi:hypothetical protein